MPKNSQNPKTPFEIIRELLDDDASYSDSIERMFHLISDGKIDMHIVAEACVASVSVPFLAECNSELGKQVKHLTELLDMADKDIRMYSEERKEMAIALQGGMTIEKEREAGIKMLRALNPKGVVVN